MTFLGGEGDLMVDGVEEAHCFVFLRRANVGRCFLRRWKYGKI